MTECSPARGNLLYLLPLGYGHQATLLDGVNANETQIAPLNEGLNVLERDFVGNSSRRSLRNHGLEFDDAVAGGNGGPATLNFCIAYVHQFLGIGNCDLMRSVRTVYLRLRS